MCGLHSSGCFFTFEWGLQNESMIVSKVSVSSKNSESSESTSKWWFEFWMKTEMWEVKAEMWATRTEMWAAKADDD
jgi:hypothetical protein